MINPITSVVILGELIGKTIVKIQKKIEVRGRTEIYLQFTDTEGIKYRLQHSNSCCELVKLEDICGNLKDLQHSPIVQAELVTEITRGDWEATQWSFYKFATNKGSVTLRFLGESNGYYSTSVDFEVVK